MTEHRDTSGIVPLSDEAFGAAALRARGLVMALEAWRRDKVRSSLVLLGGFFALYASVGIATALEAPTVVLVGLVALSFLAMIGLPVVVFLKGRRLLALFDEPKLEFERVTVTIGAALARPERHRTSLDLPRSRAVFGNPGLLDRIFPMQPVRMLLGLLTLELFEETIETRRVTVFVSGVGTGLRVETSWGGQLLIGLEEGVRAARHLCPVEVPRGLEAQVFSADPEVGAAWVADPANRNVVASLRAIPGVSIPLLWAGPERVTVSLQTTGETTPQTVAAAVDSCRTVLVDMVGRLESTCSVAKPVSSPAWARRLAANPGPSLRALYRWFDIVFGLSVVMLRWAIWIALAGVAFALAFSCLGGAVLGIVYLVQGGPT